MAVSQICSVASDPSARVMSALARENEPPSAVLLEERLIAALHEVSPCPVLVERRPSKPQQGINRDLRVQAGSRASQWLRVWRNNASIIASCRQARSTHFASARLISEVSGWPVATRRSGGTAVVHRPGILNVSLVSLPQSGEPLSVGRDYETLLSLLCDMMAGMGIACDAGEVRGAHCDGKFNLRWHGRKLAGTAACITRSGGRAVRLFHASLAVSGPIEQDLAAIRRFETALGEPRDYDPAAHVTVEQILEGGTGFASAHAPVLPRTTSAKIRAM